MEITERELNILMEESPKDNNVLCRYGPGWVELRNVPENVWAREIISKMRGGNEITN